jgi:hypothetical protein
VIKPLHFVGRIVALIAFVAGGVLTWFVIAALRGFGASQAGMSASAVSSPPSIDALIPWLACSYFMVSALGVVVCQRREALKAAALVAHIFLFAAFLAICSEGIGKGAEKFLTGVLLLGVITLLFFCPWFVVWGVLLFRRNGAG